MATDLARQITARAYILEPSGLDRAMRQLGFPDWPTTVQDLSFQEIGTGGGCRMLVATLPGDGEHQVVITDGEADLPQTEESYWLALLDIEEAELISVSSHRST